MLFVTCATLRLIGDKASMSSCREAIVVNTDDKPFHELPIIISRLADPRIRILDFGNRKYDPGMTAYALMDEVITHCSA